MLIRLPNPFFGESHLDILAAVESLNYRTCPPWLGNFKFKMIKSLDKLPTILKQEFKDLNSLVPAQRFNTWFIQQYEPGQNVKPHRDPLNNKGLTIVSLYGQLWRTILTVDKIKYFQSPGQIFVFPTTINNTQGPIHSMNWDTPENAGVTQFTTRWALICNTIEN